MKGPALIPGLNKKDIIISIRTTCSYALIRVLGDHQVDMTLIVKKSTPSEAFKIYRINDVVVFANYNVHVDTSIDM